MEYSIGAIRALMVEWGKAKRSEVFQQCAGYPRSSNFVTVVGGGVDVSDNVEVIGQLLVVLNEQCPDRYKLLKMLYYDGFEQKQIQERLGKSRTWITGERKVAEGMVANGLAVVDARIVK